MALLVFIIDKIFVICRDDPPPLHFFLLIHPHFVVISREIPEMEVTEIISAKICRFCQLSSHSRGFFARVYTGIHRAQPMDFFGAQDTIQ
jgi:hypothetical protein